MCVDLLSYPGGEVCDVAVDAGAQDLAEAHAAPGRQAEQRPAAALLAHQRAAAVALHVHAHRCVSDTHTRRSTATATQRYHAGVDRSRVVAGAKHSGSDGLHVEVGLALGPGDDPDRPFLEFEGHWGRTRTCTHTRTHT